MIDQRDVQRRFRDVPERRPNHRLSNPVTYGGGCLVLMLRLALVLVLGIYLMVLTGRVTDAQTPQPTVYTVTKTQSGYVYWFETDRDECYLYVYGISCLRKEK